MNDYRVAAAEDFAEGDRRVVLCGDKEIAVFRHEGQFYGWHNRCPHQEGPVCQGRIMYRVLEPVDADGRTGVQLYDEHEAHIICPWHGWEFSIRTGEHPGNRRARLRKVEIDIREGDVYVRL
ncbi:MAG TPA: Rieske (2Fe-2S) protein [Stellaceae bacterium]|jgi:nitrite reductase/ring-hydroxylating ferredoxin subunit|nr:Rieske (2Fe-2S) protein [Stellaceae bacterium]